MFLHPTYHMNHLLTYSMDRNRESGVPTYRTDLHLYNTWSSVSVIIMLIFLNMVTITITTHEVHCNKHNNHEHGHSSHKLSIYVMSMYLLMVMLMARISSVVSLPVFDHNTKHHRGHSNLHCMNLHPTCRMKLYSTYHTELLPHNLWPEIHDLTAAHLLWRTTPKVRWTFFMWHHHHNHDHV